jgi:gluconokinase
MKSYILSLDIGTTSSKAVLFDREGYMHASHAVEYPLHTPTANRAEQDPNQIVHAAMESIKQTIAQTHIKSHEIRCMSISSAMHSLILVDEQGDPLTPCITWADNRSSAYVDILRTQYDAHSIYMASGMPIHPMSPLLKIMWIHDHEPKLFSKAHKFISIKEYLIYRWCHQYLIDQSIASTTGLYDLNTKTWYAPSLQACHIKPEQLSTIVPTTHVIDGIHRIWAEKMGISHATPIVIGASDGVLANLGNGAIDSQKFAITIGTSGAIRTVVERPVTDPLERTFCYALTEDRWVIGGAINNGGVLLRWIRDELAMLETADAYKAGIDPYDHLISLAQSVPPGADGLLMLPFFTGERSPLWNADARGVFFGLSLAHGKKHMIRATLEGICYALRSVSEAMQHTTSKPLELRASGGFARSAFWRQLVSDVLGLPLSIPKSTESSAAGAALLGLYAIGDITNLYTQKSWYTTIHQHQPNPINQAIYDELFSIYMDLYPRLNEPFKHISHFQSKLKSI